MPYIPRNVPSSPDELPSFLSFELPKIAQEWDAERQFVLLNTLYAAPARLREGLIVKADGVTWNPGEGAGVYEYVASAWVKLGRQRESFVIACGDETTAITVGVAKRTWRAPYAFTLLAVRASCNTAPTGSTIIIDVNEGGLTLLSTKLSIDASEKTSTTAASAAVISDSTIADDAELSIDFDQVGSAIAGAGVKVTLIVRRT